MPESIYTAAVVFQRDDGAILTARKRGTSRFMLVGGKLEPGEIPRQAAVRETREEINISLGADNCELLGMWRTPAANEAERDVHATVYVARMTLTELPTPAAEIEQVRWLEPQDALPDDLAPLLVMRVLPALGWEQDGGVDHQSTSLLLGTVNIYRWLNTGRPTRCVAAWRQAHEEFWGQGRLPDDELIVLESITFHPLPMA